MEPEIAREYQVKQLTVTNNDSHRGISFHLKSTLFFSLRLGRPLRRRKPIPLLVFAVSNFLHVGTLGFLVRGALLLLFSSSEIYVSHYVGKTVSRIKRNFPLFSCPADV